MEKKQTDSHGELNNNILVIVGPTSSGKTSLALDIAKKTDSAIISADSRQIYKEMDVGTGKVPINSAVVISRGESKWIIDDVEVYGYDLATPEQYFSAYDYAVFALSTINELLKKGKKIIMTGGTGFYIDLVTAAKILNSKAPDFQLRGELEKQNLSSLVEQLKTIAPDEARNVDLANRVRVIRALEKILSTNESIPLPTLRDVTFSYYGLIANHAHLYARADSWVDTVWHMDLLEETAKLAQKYGDCLRLQGVVYKTAFAALQGALDMPTAIQQTKWDLHAYIRRQLTWFKKNKNIHWLNIADCSREKCIIEISTPWINKS